MVDARGEEAGAEAVVDVDDGDAGRAGVEHGEERGETLERGAVADARRDGDHGDVDEPADDARERALHPRDGDDDARALQLADVGEQALEPGDADVVEPHDAVPERLGRLGGLLGDRQVARAGGADADLAGAVGLRGGTDDGEAARRVPPRVRFCGRERGGLRRVEPRDEHPPRAAPSDRADDGADLLGRLARPVDHLGGALAQLPPVVHLGEPEVLERRRPEPRRGLLRRERPRPHLLHHPFEFPLGHAP